MMWPTGDFNGDGYPDLAFTEYVGGLFPKGAVHVVLNNKHGGFEAPVTYDTAGKPFSIAIADIDGNTDLLVGEEGKGFREGDVLLLANNGNGTFTEAGRFPSEEGFGPILGADLTGDGAADILEGDSDGTVATLLDIGQPTPSPSSLTFPSVPKGQEGTPQSVTITNSGAAPTTIEGLSLAGATPGDFDLDNAGLALGPGSCSGVSLAPGASCSANVAFRPTEVGAASHAARLQRKRRIAGERCPQRHGRACPDPSRGTTASIGTAASIASGARDHRRAPVSLNLARGERARAAQQEQEAPDRHHLLVHAQRAGEHQPRVHRARDRAQGGRQVRPLESQDQR
jgi:hypothetical protein